MARLSVAVLGVLLALGGSEQVLPAATPAAASELDPVRVAIRRKEFAVAQRELEALARKGNAQAQYRLGAMLLANPVAAPDPQQATQWLQKAAGAGEPRAAYLLSVLAATQSSPDVAAARRWLEQAAAGGVPPARELLEANRLPLRFLPAVDLQEQAAREAAMLAAVRRDDIETLALLVAPGSVGVRDAFDRQLLSVAALADAPRAARWLLEQGAQPESRDRDGATALILAVQSPRASVLPVLLSGRADINARDSRGNSALHVAARSGDDQRVHQLLAAGASVDVANADGDASLDLALRDGSAAVIAALRAAGAHSNRPATAGNAPVDTVRRVATDAYAGRSDLEVAAARRDPQLLTVLLARGGITQAARDAALIAAVEAGSLESARKLLDSGARPATRDGRGNTPVDLAVAQDDKAMLELLLKHGARLDQAVPPGVPPLVAAVTAGRSAAAAVLLAAGASTSSSDGTGRNVLCIAAQRGDAELFASLLAHTDAKQKGVLRDALGCAVTRGDAALAARLIAAGADVRQKDRWGRIALVDAAVSGDEETVRTLLAAGADVNVASEGGLTALMRAVMGDHAAVVRRMIAGGADVNARDRDGETALTLAARDASEEVVQALLAAGAQASYRNADRANAEDIARGLHRERVAGLLAKH